MTNQIEAYAEQVQNLINKEYDDHRFRPTVQVEYLKKYARIVKAQKSSKSVHSFVEIETGNTFKAASWKTPAKGVRGNISNLTKGFSAYSAWYSR